MSEINVDNLVERLGEEKLRELSAAFYRRVKTDPILGKMYPDDDWDGAEERLADFLVMRFGGSTAYMEKRGHPRLRMRHAPFVIGAVERDQWLTLMGESMREVGIPQQEGVVMAQFFAQIADFMRNSPH
ncbi:globin [Sulfuriroseicoccus oceanibius]|uniref:Globin n=1 Tax=Sulfuriroseicoccus oceanibius TaxID=2707525 RepID=A0A6B3L9M0_9BACT|nr:globin [Sulfuriroseicoccus oceanibius]QQL46206.1 globin [Sulfuriroseicoccus oceanibius]